MKFPLNGILCKTSSSLLITVCVSVVFMHLCFQFLLVVLLFDSSRERAISGGIMKHLFTNENVKYVSSRTNLLETMKMVSSCMYLFMDKKLLSTDTGLLYSRMRSPIARAANDLQ